jgi:hypothetical protein
METIYCAGKNAVLRGSQHRRHVQLRRITNVPRNGAGCNEAVEITVAEFSSDRKYDYRHTCGAACPQGHLQKFTALNLRANEDRANTDGNHERDNDREIHIGSAELERSVDPEDLLPAELNVDLAIRILRLLAT